MGHYTSKLFYNNNHDVKMEIHSEAFSFDKSHGTPITCRKRLPIDPRSVSIDILRTPIEVKYQFNSYEVNCEITKKEAIVPCYKIIKPLLETNFDNNILELNEKQYKTSRDLNSSNPKNSFLIKDIFESDMSNINVLNKLNSVNLNPIEFNISNLDPRSPSYNFERTPILKIKTKKKISLFQEDLTEKRNNPNLDICIKLSYCDTTSPLKISKIQKLPNFLINLDKCNVQDEMNYLNLSISSDNSSKKSNSILKNTIAFSSEQIYTSLTSKSLYKTNEIWKNIEILTKSNSSSINSVSNNCKELKNTFRSLDNGNQQFVTQNFLIWRDSSPEIFSRSSIINSNYLQENFKIYEKNISTLDSYIVKNKIKNINKNIEKKVGLNNKIKEEVENKKSNKQEKFSSIYKPPTELTWTHTSLSNRSNKNKPDQIIKMNFSQEILLNKYVRTKDFQENTPLLDISLKKT